MNEDQAKIFVEEKYSSVLGTLEYLGKDNNSYVFGFLNKDSLLTYERPFYIIVDNDVITEAELPMIADDAYDASKFAELESEYSFFEKSGILDPIEEDEDIEDDDILITDSVLNALDESVENGVGYNPYRDADGKFASGGAGGVMSQEAAKAAIKNSAYTKPVYHGTASDYAKNISQEGFKNNPEGANIYGEAVYFSQDPIEAFNYGVARDKDTPKVVSAYINVKNVFDGKKMGDIVAKKMVEKGYWSDTNSGNKTFEDYRNWQAEFKESANEILKTHDALTIPYNNEHAGMVLVRDPKNIKIFGVEEGRVAVERHFKELNS